MEATNVRVRIPDLAVDSTLFIADRATSRGVGPRDRPVQYETLLLGGDYAGVAFLIHPERGGGT